MSIELDIPDIKVLVRTDPNYNVVIQNPRSAVYRSGSYMSVAETALFAETASHANNNILTASAAGNTITFTKGNATTFSIELSTGSVDSASFATTASYAQTINRQITGSVVISDDLTVQGIISAEKLLVSSSVIYESGSTKFGDSSNDTHQFTGSVLVQGPIEASTGITGSFKGDGSQLTGLVTDLRISGSTGSDTLNLLTDDLTFSASKGIEVAVTNNKVTIEVPVGLSASLYGTASVAEGIHIVSAGIYLTGSDGVIIPAPSGGYTYISTASYALTASYIANNTWDNLLNIPTGLLSSSVQVYPLPVESASYALTASYAMNGGGGGSTFNISQLPDDTLVGDNISSSVGGTPIEIDYGITKGDFANRFTGVKIYNYDYSGGNLAGQVEFWTDSEAQDYSTRRFYIDGFGKSVFTSNVEVTGSLTTTGNVIAQNYVQTSLLYNGGPIEIRSYYLPLQINSNGAGIILNDNVQVTGSLTVSGSSTLTNIGPAIFSGSLDVTNGITGSLYGTSSWAEQAVTASYVVTASYAMNGGGGGGTGSSGTSGTSGANGVSGTSGSSGTSGTHGSSGTSGTTGSAGTSGSSGTSGTHGSSGTSGQNGSSGSSGESGSSGTSGSSGSTGTSGTSGTNGRDGQSNNLFQYQATGSISGDPGAGHIAWNNATQASASALIVNHLDKNNSDIDVFLAIIPSGSLIIIQDADNSDHYQKWTVGTGVETSPNLYWTFPVTLVESTYSYSDNEHLLFVIAQLPSGTSGTSGTSGQNGSSGSSGESGTSGSSGTSGVTGSSGTSGQTGSSGTSGQTGSSGTSGINGSSGTSGQSGSSGTTGSAGTSGSSGTSGITGSSGTSGNNGTMGSSGTSGQNGTSGSSGSSGTSGITGTSGSSGTSGVTGTAGSSGTSGQSITINNNTDNFVLTATGTANTLNGESGLTYDGTKLLVSTIVSSSQFTSSINNAVGYFGTASWAVSSSHATTASFVSTNPATASFAVTSSYIQPLGLPQGVVSSSAQIASFGNIRLQMGTNRSNATAFYFNSNTRTAGDSASPSADTAFLIQSTGLSTVTVYLRQDNAGPNATIVGVAKNANGAAFSGATLVTSSSLSLTGDTIQTYTFSGLTLNQFDAIHIYCDPTSTPGTLFAVVLVS